MTQRLLQVLGVVLILGLIGGAVAGFTILKDRVRVIIAADEVATGPDPAALLRDDVQDLARKLDDLQSALASNFEKLARAIDERADARHVEVMALRQEIDGIRRRVEALSEATKTLTASVQGWSADRTAVAIESDSSRGSPQSQPILLTEEAVTSIPDTSIAPTSKPAGFLSFSMPASQFRFDEVQDYVLIPELSRVGFDGKSTLHDFSGVTSQVRGGFRADFDDPNGACSGEIFVKAETLKTGIDGRDSTMREHLDTKNHAEIGFVIERFVPAAGGVNVVKQTARGDVVGKMTIRGQTHPLQMTVTIEVDPQKRVVVKGESPLKLSDYGVPVPSQLGVINMQDEVKIWIAFRARMQKGRVK